MMSIQTEVENAGCTLADLVTLADFMAYHADSGEPNEAAASALRIIGHTCQSLRRSMEQIEVDCMIQRRSAAQ